MRGNMARKATASWQKYLYACINFQVKNDWRCCVVGIIDACKVRAACKDRGVDGDAASLYVYVHYLTDGGKKGIGAFELKDGESLEAGEDVKQRMGSLDSVVLQVALKVATIFDRTATDIGFSNPRMPEVLRMYADPGFRARMYGDYSTLVKSRVGDYSLPETIAVLQR